MTDFSKALGSMLRNLRLARGFSQLSVAAQLNVTRSTYAVYEAGRSLPDVEQLRTLAELFAISPAAFFYPEKHVPMPITRQRVSNGPANPV